MWVVKIGGSLETAPGLRALLALLAECGHSRISLCPAAGASPTGCAPSSETRALDDATAHRLAVRAMEQYGAVLCGMESRLYPVTGVGEVCGAEGTSTVPVWLPGRLLADEPAIPRELEGDLRQPGPVVCREDKCRSAYPGQVRAEQDKRCAGACRIGLPG